MVGTTISHYKVLEKIGEGGMGVVYNGELNSGDILRLSFGVVGRF